MSPFHLSKDIVLLPKHLNLNSLHCIDVIYTVRVSLLGACLCLLRISTVGSLLLMPPLLGGLDKSLFEPMTYRIGIDMLMHQGISGSQDLAIVFQICGAATWS